MASPAQTPPPKASRARHQHSKSATPAAPGTGGKPVPRRQRNNRNNNESNTVQYQPFQTENGFGPPLQYSQNEEYYSSKTQPKEYTESNGALSEGPRPPKQRQGRPAQQQFAPRDGMDHATLPTSPPGAKSPVVHGAVATPAKSQAAYAGPTFHASPAPSALPLPKFFSKSVPGTSTQLSLQARLENEMGDASPEPSPPSPPSPPVAPTAAATAEPPIHEDSPLDILFKADREEKAKRGSGLFTPDSKQNQAAPAAQPLPNGTLGPDLSHHSRHSSTGSGKGLFMMELDGGASVPARTSPAFTAPGSRSVTAPSRIPQTGTNIPNNPEHDTKSLKDILFSLAQPNPQPSTPYTGFDRIPSEPSSRFNTPSPFNQPRSNTRSSSGPTTPAPQNNGPANPSLYYGNRNLSPLFKAAKTDSAKRTSSLRQEVTAASPTLKGFPYHGEPESPVNNVRRTSSHNADPRSVSRQYLETVMSSTTSSRPFQPSGQSQGSYAMNGPSQRPNNEIFQPNFQYQSPVAQTAGAIPQANMPAPSSKKSTYQPKKNNEVRSMEDDLRRILNISSVDGNFTGVR